MIELIHASDYALEQETDAAIAREANLNELGLVRKRTERTIMSKIDALHDLSSSR